VINERGEVSREEKRMNKKNYILLLNKLKKIKKEKKKRVMVASRM